MKCFECDAGIYKEVTIDYVSQLSGGRSCLTKNVMIRQCNSCKSEILDSKASKMIESNIELNFPGYYNKWKNRAEIDMKDNNKF
jgi:hypothetical protein